MKMLFPSIPHRSVKYTTQQGLWGGRPTVLRLLRGLSYSATRTNEAARTGRPEGPAASPRGQRRLPRHRGGDNRAILDKAPDALHPRRNAHNCGAASAGASDMNKIYSHPNAHSQPAQSASLARMRDSRLSTPLELSDVLAIAT